MGECLLSTQRIVDTTVVYGIQLELVEVMMSSGSLSLAWSGQNQDDAGSGSQKMHTNLALLQGILSSTSEILLWFFCAILANLPTVVGIVPLLGSRTSAATATARRAVLLRPNPERC
ncbi:hypothetical protein UY3_07742 [Chelonia mydas]|uniref:Uncharacterized protein n=1 Tax=Chelonia mydas TaxID=8469 RepID=M7BSL5_CHEMY|nr:hypothetical protein UY3_07742 [Chelonia mydas]